MDSYFRPLLDQTDVNTALLGANAASQRLIAAKIESNSLLQSETIRLKAELEAAEMALREADDLLGEWQAAMLAWRDLANLLREEIKACPNHEAHTFGKDRKATNNKVCNMEDSYRIKRGLKPRYSPEEKGLSK